MDPCKSANSVLLQTTLMLKSLHEEGQYCDVQLQVGTSVFKSSRGLLAAVSEYFDTMFQSNFKESSTTNDEPIVLHELDASAFKEILHFMYTGSVHVTKSNLYHLLFMSDFLRLHSANVVEHQCVEYLNKNCSQEFCVLSDVFDLYAFSYIKEKKFLIDTLSANICQHLFHYSSKDAKFMELSFESFNALLKWSKTYILPFKGIENIILKIILNWINHSRQERSKYRGQLMKRIKASNVSSRFMLLWINQLENFTDKAVGLPRNVESFDKLKKLESELKIGMNDDSIQFRGTITFEVKDINSTYVNMWVDSLPSIISNLSWKISIMRTTDGYVNFYLDCDGAPEDGTLWSCCVRYELIIISHKKGVNSLISEGEVKFKSGERSSWGEDEFAQWVDIIDPGKGFIKDNAVTFQAHLHTDVPCVLKNKV